MIALEKLAGPKDDDAPPGEEAPSAPLVETFNLIKDSKKVTRELLARFTTQIGLLEKALPTDLVEISVNKRLLARQAEGEGQFKPLPEPTNPRYGRKPPNPRRDDGF